MDVLEVGSWMLPRPLKNLFLLNYFYKKKFILKKILKKI